MKSTRFGLLAVLAVVVLFSGCATKSTKKEIKTLKAQVGTLSDEVARLDESLQETRAAIQAEEKSDHAHLAIKAKETRPFDKALTAIEANPWLETCMWLVTISIEGYSALRFVLDEYQLMNRAKKSFLKYAQEIGRMPQFIICRLSSLRDLLHQKASFKASIP